MERFLEDEAEYRSVNWREEFNTLQTSEIEVEILPDLVEGTNEPTAVVEDTNTIDKDEQGAIDQDEPAELGELEVKKVTAESLRVHVNLKLLETKQSPELYGFSYPDVLQSNYIEEQIAFSFIDLSEFHELRTKFYPIKHQFITAAYEAYDKHLGFTLSPSQLYLLILQQISIHQYSLRKQEKQKSHHSEEEANSEDSDNIQTYHIKDREYKSLQVEFNLPPEDDDFHQIIDFIREAMSESIEGYYDGASSFTTASEEELLATESCFYNQQEEFFQYEYAPSRCGIPYFLLEGNLSDWISLRERSEQAIKDLTLPSFSERWLPIILPILDRLVRIKEKNSSDLSLADIQLMKNFVKVGEVAGSGAYTYITGWINSFFPLTSHQKWNKYCMTYDQYLQSIISKSNNAEIEEAEETEDGDVGLDILCYPMGLNTIPIDWKYQPQAEEEKVSDETEEGEEEWFKLHLYSGFIGMKEESDHLKPVVGWWISLLKEVKSKSHKTTNQFKDMEREFGNIFS